jgi:hypothetical protein
MQTQNVFQNTLNWPKLNPQHASNFKYSNFSASEAQFLHSYTQLHPFCCQWTSQAIFSTVHATDNAKPLTNPCSHQCLPSKSYCQQFDSFHNNFPHSTSLM